MSRSVTAACFPTPHLALRSSNTGRRQLVQAFAQRQAQEADRLRMRLADDLRDMAHPLVRAELLRAGYAEAHAWRYSLALGSRDSRGSGTVVEAGRVLMSLERGGLNADRLGYVGRYRDGREWDEERRQFTGGTSTPAHEILVHFGELARARFDDEGVRGDVLRNRVRLPDGREIVGNRLVRGRTALRIAALLAARRQARGHDVARMETGGDPLYAVSGSTRSRALCWDAGLAVLGSAEHGDVDAWRNAAYLLYQGIRHKRGSDAALRVFLVAVGAVLLDEPPVLPHDLDLRCMVLSQRAATDAEPAVAR